MVSVSSGASIILSDTFVCRDECQEAVNGFSSPYFKKVESLPSALEFLITKAHRLGDATDITSPRAPTLNLAGLSLTDGMCYYLHPLYSLAKQVFRISIANEEPHVWRHQ